MSESTGGGAEGIQSFPTEAVVGVVRTPEEAAAVQEELRRHGLEAHVLAGDEGTALIKHAGGGSLSLRLSRAVQELFGYETEHTERHLAELERGHLLVVVESRDETTTTRVRDALAAHGGHFANYYSRWTSRELLP